VGLAFTPVNQFLLLGLGVFTLLPKRNLFKAEVAYPLVALALFSLALLITALLIVHFALAFTIGVLALPLTFVPTLMKKQSPYTSLCLVVSNPFAVVVAGGYILGLPELFSRLTTAWDDLQCWTWFVVVLGWFPAWLIVAIGYWGYRPLKEKTE
jgi:glycosylphosphatidylinositol transamidase